MPLLPPPGYAPEIDIVDIVDRYIVTIVDKLNFDCQLFINFNS